MRSSTATTFQELFHCSRIDSSWQRISKTEAQRPDGSIDARWRRGSHRTCSPCRHMSGLQADRRRKACFGYSSRGFRPRWRLCSPRVGTLASGAIESVVKKTQKRTLRASVQLPNSGRLFMSTARMPFSDGLDPNWEG